MPSLAIAMLGLAVAFVPTFAARSAELKILSGGSMMASLNELAPQFEHASGHKLTIHFDSTPNLIKLAVSGAPFDLGVVPADVMQDPAARARFVPGPMSDIARAGYGVAVRSGAPKPDISTPEALKAAFLAARSIATLPESAAGAYVMKIFGRLGIAEAVQAKIKVQGSPSEIPKAVARGDAELGVFLSNVLAVPGVELAGPFPASLQQELVFIAAVAADSKNADAATAFIAYLKTTAAAAVLKAKGLTPG
jgi:molybdate transport system substrate-binding protein